jgi:phage-related protein
MPHSTNRSLLLWSLMVYVYLTARVLYFYVKGARMVITHGFIKKGKKTDPKEIERAITLRTVYEQRGLK